ncbi:LysR family transcriptional regulator [Bacillus sp. RO2]|uniref:LysR family transcriptional regulator n=1 Tax=Bacillus sp. RO2 TaxID=2723913 RepID=UPI00145E7494|nr:LysR family transcriptional regulator [Bacillus sp. RO2]NMH73971.1 LysR family transcriptional regulator [Bacillus sp. RO2]
MDIKQLITFHHAASTLNFTQTAKVLNFAQSSVTAQIKGLEKEVGKPLFERLGKKLILTEAGIQFKNYAEKMIRLSEEAIVATQGEDVLTGSLTIGAQESQCTYRLPSILKEYKASFPKVKLIFRPAHSDEMARKKLMEGELDVAFIMDKSSQKGSLRMEKLAEEELKLVIAPDYPKKLLTVSDLVHETLLLTETGCSYRDMFKDYLSSEGIFPTEQIEFGSIEAIKQCVIAGLGVALLPKMVVQKELNEGKMRELPFTASTPPLFTHLAWHKDKQMTKPLAGFIELTRMKMKSG